MAKLGLMAIIAAAVALASCSREQDLFADEGSAATHSQSQSATETGQ